LEIAKDFEYFTNNHLSRASVIVYASCREKWLNKVNSMYQSPWTTIFAFNCSLRQFILECLHKHIRWQHIGASVNRQQWDDLNIPKIRGATFQAMILKRILPINHWDGKLGTEQKSKALKKNKNRHRTLVQNIDFTCFPSFSRHC